MGLYAMARSPYGISCTIFSGSPSPNMACKVFMGRTLTLIAFSGLLIGCSGGGGGGGGPSAGEASATVVAGAVQAPNGQIAFQPAPSFFEQFISTTSAFASVPGLTSLPDGTTVQL